MNHNHTRPNQTAESVRSHLRELLQQGFQREFEAVWPDDRLACVVITEAGLVEFWGDVDVGALAWDAGWTSSQAGFEADVPVKGRDLLLLHKKNLGRSDGALRPLLLHELAHASTQRRFIPVEHASGRSSETALTDFVRGGLPHDDNLHRDDEFLSALVRSALNLSDGDVRDARIMVKAAMSHNAIFDEDEDEAENVDTEEDEGAGV